MSRWLNCQQLAEHLARMRGIAEAQGRVKTENKMLPEGAALGTKSRGRPKGGGVGQHFEPEAVVLRNILKYLSLDKRVRWVHRMNSGAIPVEGKRFVRFGFAGCPDVMLQLVSGKVGWIEVKSLRGRPTAAQDAFLRLSASEHTFGGIARGLDDVKAILEAVK